jgi:hypothetical protein
MVGKRNEMIRTVYRRNIERRNDFAQRRQRVVERRWQCSKVRSVKTADEYGGKVQ